ncbi:MAG: hypothetical protein Q7S57_01520 [bacterium]|nr:hypothetical protein [bacterium]
MKNICPKMNIDTTANFQMSKFSKHVGVVPFGNFGIGHSLEIGNWKLVIRDFVDSVVVINKLNVNKLSCNLKAS